MVEPSLRVFVVIFFWNNIDFKNLLRAKDVLSAFFILIRASISVSSPRTKIVSGIWRGGEINGSIRFRDVLQLTLPSRRGFVYYITILIVFVYFRYVAAQRRRNEKNSRKNDADSLPSYTIVTGLPTYDEAVERMHGESDTAAATGDNKPPTKHEPLAVVDIGEDVSSAKPDPKFGLVSHSLFVHDDGCSHCLSVQELLETYNVR